MKVGILTVPTLGSFGASLQLYALYHAVEKLGVEPEVINYQNEYMRAGRHVKVSWNNPVKKLIRKAMHYRQDIAFCRFEKGMLRYPKKKIRIPDELAEVSGRYDGVICGSDQVWNPDITGADLSYFLNFCSPNTSRISYAPSFGRAELPEAFLGEIRKELKQFQYLSVREAEGQDILRLLLDTEVPVVLDPSFLLNSDEWSRLEKKYSVAREPYILYYTIRSSKTLMNFCMELAEKKNMKVVIVGGNVIRRMRNRNSRIDYAFDIGPQEWLYLLHHADCIVTNSFHGAAFSINYQKDFYVEYSSLTNSRLENIIRTTGLQERVVQDGCFLTDERIEYGRVDRIVEELRKTSLMYLKKAVIQQ